MLEERAVIQLSLMETISSLRLKVDKAALFKVGTAHLSQVEPEMEMEVAAAVMQEMEQMVETAQDLNLMTNRWAFPVAVAVAEDVHRAARRMAGMALQI